MTKIPQTKWILAAGNKSARIEYAKRSNGQITADKIIEFPTRYDDRYYNVRDRNEARLQLK
jgi:hypothetical protein